MTVLEELQQATQRALGRAGPAVVRIGRGPGRGSGFVLGEGVVVTNAHNLRGSQATVTFADERSVTGEVMGVDPEQDLATLSVDTAGTAELSWSPEGATAGQAVFALALPAGGGVRVTPGAVSALGRAFRGPRDHLIVDGVEHTAPLGRGSSGGPLVDAEGALLAVNTHRLGDGFYLALPATAELRARLDGLALGQSPTRRRLGVALVPAEAARKLRAAVGLPARDGLLVRSVADESPAATSGLQRGDLLVAAGEVPLMEVDDLVRVLDALGDDPSVALGVVRGAEELTVVVTFA